MIRPHDQFLPFGMNAQGSPCSVVQLNRCAVVDDPTDYIDLAKTFEGQLTTTVHMDAGDTKLANTLLPVRERKARRILFNGYPTDVEVADAMVHSSGLYPASTNLGATSVGTLSIRRFLRPSQALDEMLSSCRPWGF